MDRNKIVKSGHLLRQLRWGYAMDSARKLAARLGCHPSTIYRNEQRDRVSALIYVRVHWHTTASAFLRGMNRMEIT